MRYWVLLVVGLRSYLYSVRAWCLMISVSVLVPEERVAEFYAVVGAFLSHETAPNKPVVKKRPRPLPARRGPGRYARLTEFLNAVSGSATELSFAEVEQALGGKLPKSARKHRAFWANSERLAQARGWLDAGWVVSGLDMSGERVSFERRGA